ncbi:hypothetical protein GGI22_004440, partial [Coemansia erecta]
APRDRSQAAAKRKIMVNITLTTILLYIRSIYRIAEFADGYGGKIYSAEWAFYVFDTVIVFVAFLVYMVLYVGPNFPRRQAAGSAAAAAAASEPQDEAKSESSAQLVNNSSYYAP